jgi:predicted MFS family arabinose efflux permease
MPCHDAPMDELGPPLRPGDLRSEPWRSSHVGADRSGVWALLTGYWAFGQYWGVWVILVFEVQRLHGLSDSRLGASYALLSITAVTVMLLLAPRMRGLPLRTSITLSLASLVAGALAITFLPSGFLWVGFVLVGLGNGLVDVYFNVAAQRAEVRSGRPVLQWMHAAYALGGVTGAAAAGLIRAAGLDFRWGFIYEALVLMAAIVWNVRRASTERGSAGVDTVFSVSELFRHPGLWIAALTVLFAFLVEGSMDAWSGLYLREQLGASAAVAAIAFVGFSGAVFLGRLFAGRVLFGLGVRTTVLVSGFGAAAASALVIATDRPMIVGGAYLLLGFAISAAAPAGFGLIDRTDADPTDAVAAVTTVGYTGFVWSPPLLGYLAQTVSLRAAMAVILVATVGIVGSGLAAPRDPGGG